jgi:hypothetical protein
MPDSLKGATNEFIDRHAPQFDAHHPCYFLASTMATMQGWGQRNALMEKQGVGGAICGICATSEGIFWQPDMLYWPYAHNEGEFVASADRVVSCVVRDNFLVVSSSFTNSVSAFFNTLSSPSIDQWRTRWQAEVNGQLRKAKFDFVVALSTQNNVVALIEMRRQLQSIHLILSPFGEDGLRMSMTPPLLRFLTTRVAPGDPAVMRMGFAFLPF